MRLSPVAVVLACCTLTISSLAQGAAAHPWQSLQVPGVATVKQAWLAPPPEYGPEPYYGLNGPFTLDVAKRDLDRMVSLGFHAVTVQYGYGSGMQYLSPEWFDFFRQFVAEAKQRNMRVWIVDDAGYPSGFAGGKFSTEHPELRMQALVATKTSLAAGTKLDRAVSADTVAVTAINGKGDTIPIPTVAGHAVWTAPADSAWDIYVVEHAFRTSPTRSDTNPLRVKDTSQSLGDYLDPAATTQYIAYTHELYKRAVGEEFGKTILGFRGDEPDYSLNGLPWTGAFFARFQARKGYDIRPYVATFLQGRETKLTAQQLRARADYYDVFAEMFRDGYFKPLADWCGANGLEYQVHLNHEEMQLQLAHSEGDFFRDMRYVQVPAVDAIWHQIWTDTISDFPRFASSAAHVYGHPRALTESFAAYRPEPDITMARYIVNEQLVRGINLFEFMYYPSTSTSGRGGPAKYMQSPAFPALTTYTRRLSYLLSQGRPGADVALLLPAESLWMGDAKADEAFVSMERVLSEHQIDFDTVDEEAIGSILPLRGSTFSSLSGNHYRTVIVPHADLLPSAVVKRLRTFAHAGGHVLFIGAPPTFIAGRTNLAASTGSPADFAWAEVVPVELEPVPTPPAQPPASKPSPSLTPIALLRALKSEEARSAVRLGSPETAIRFLRRELKDATVFMLFNESAIPVTSDITLLVKGRTVERWNPEVGTTEIIPGAKFRDGHIGLPMSLPPYTTEVIVIH